MPHRAWGLLPFSQGKHSLMAWPDVWYRENASNIKNICMSLRLHVRCGCGEVLWSFVEVLLKFLWSFVDILLKFYGVCGIFMEVLWSFFRNFWKSYGVGYR